MSGAAPKLVATDLDGTIVRGDGEISDRTVAALDGVQRLGVPVVFVTGRPPRWMGLVAERTGHRGLAVCSNGALLYDLGSEQVVESFPLAVDIGLEVARRLRDALPDIGFAVETLDGFAHEADYNPHWADASARVAAIDEIYVPDRVVKLLARHELLDADALLAQAREVVGELVELTHSSISGLLEISVAGVSKATTLALVCERLGVAASDVVAFGDMPNDLPMLAWAGAPYAMEGAHADVLAAVDSRAAAVEEDGVAKVLERLFNL
jgi:hypothetical protein